MVLLLGIGPVGPVADHFVALAEQTTLSLESVNTANPIDGQEGWNADGAAGAGCAVYDAHFDALPGPIKAIATGFGNQALRISNAVTSGCFSDQTFSSSLTNEAGETAAATSAFSGGVRSAFYEASWDIISATADANTEQPGLFISISPDRGDGARMSYIGIGDSPTGLNFTFYDFQSGPNDFVPTIFAADQPRNAVYNIKLQMIFVDGPGNDIVRVFLNNTLMHTGTSWEDYFPALEGVPTRAVDSLLFRSGGTAAPGTAGKGFYFDNISLTAGLTSVFVRTDGSDTACDGTADAAATGSGVCAVQTIARGAQLAAALGATVNVGPGTYGESAITLPAKNTFTLKGTQAGNRPVISNGLILSTVSDLRLENLIVEGADDSGSAATTVVQGSSITNFTMKNVKIDGENVAQRHGISGGQFSGNISITESQFEDIPNWSAFDTRSGSGGATAGANIGTAVFNDNTLTNVQGHINFRSTITASPSAVIQVMNNTITGTGNATNSFGGIIKIFYAASATISGNTFKDVGTSGFNPGGEQAYGAAVLPRQVTNLTIQNNLFEDNNQAIAIEPRNTTSGGFPDGVLSQGTISNNTFLNNKFAVYIPATLHPTSNLAGLSVTNNSFTTNVSGGQGVHNGSTAGNVPATSNWWSSSSGPSHASNASPNGVVVTDHVTFTPFLTRGTDTSASIGFQPDTTPIVNTFVRTDGSDTECDGSADAAFTTGALGACSVASVQKGVNNAQAGATVNVGAGTFVGANAAVSTSKSVNILGAGRSSTILDGLVAAVKTNSRGIEFNTGVNGASVKNLTVTRFNQHGVFFGGFAGAGVGPSNITVDNVESSDNGDVGQSPGTAAGSARGIVVWDGAKTNITITNSIANNNSLVGIDLQDGTVANATVTGNTVTGNRDSGIGVQGPKTALIVANNTVTNNGRFGIEIKNPDGPTSGTSPLVVEGNTVSRTVTATDPKDHAGILVMRRDPVGGVNVDQPAGVIVRNNDVDGFHANAPSTTGDGFCIVVEGTNMAVRNNNVTNCDVGIQMQKGNTANVQSTQFFDRGNAADYSGITELNNVATSNTTGVRGVGLTAAANATRNWWGNASGPTNANNPSGTGSTLVGTNISFSPWLGDGTDTSGSTGFQPNLTLVALNTQGINVSPTAGLTTTENGGQAFFSVGLASQPTDNVVIGLSSSNTSEGTVSPASLTFTPANWNVPQSVTVTGVSSGPSNGNVAYTIITAPAVSNDPLFNGIDPSDVSVTNNAASNPTISIGDASVTEGDGALTQMTFNVTLSQAHTRTVTVNFATAPGTAAANTDYVTTNGTVTFNPGETTKPINITIQTDLAPESDETFTVTLTNPVEASLARAQATGTITNDDIAPSAGTCSPRPNIQVTSAASGGRRMQVTVKADTSSPNQSNVLTQIQFGTPVNATIQMLGQSSISTSPIALPSGTKQIVFEVQQTDPNSAYHVPFKVTDSCGSVDKFVGGGKDAVAN